MHSALVPKTPFWESYCSDQLLGLYLKPTYEVIGPNNELFVAKPRDLHSSHSVDARIIRLFQELTVHYGLPINPELTVLPQHHNGDFKGIRVAKFVPALKLSRSVHGDRKKLSLEQQAELDEYFPENIFDDFYEIDAHSQGTTYYKKRIYTLDLNTQKFESFYKSIDSNSIKSIDQSLGAFNKMFQDGILFDVYGLANLGVRNSAFTLLDAEPMQANAAHKLTASVLTDSTTLLNTLFDIVGLPSINYQTVLQLSLW